MTQEDWFSSEAQILLLDCTTENDLTFSLIAGRSVGRSGHVDNVTSVMVFEEAETGKANEQMMIV